MTNHSVLACLPAAGPENVFESIVNRHHDDMRARAARRAQERRKRELVKWGIAATVAACAAAAAVWYAVTFALPILA